MADWPLARTPFYFVGPRPYRENELAAYICGEHRRGRDLTDILGDRRVTHCGSEALARAVLCRPSLIRELGCDVADAIRRQQAELATLRGRNRDEDG